MYLSDHLKNIGIEKYEPSAFKCRVARILSSPGCKNTSSRMKKFLTYICEYLLGTREYCFYTLLIPKVFDLLPKGQQKLTTFWDLIEEGLSYLQLFLELLELT